MTYAVLVMFDTDAAREAAVAFCDDLVKRFWSKCGFDVHWCTATELTDVPKAA
jgi:hypothetical protein